MRHFYYFGCRGTEGGHFLHSDSRYADGRITSDRNHLDGGFPIYLLDRTFAPLDPSDRSWRLTQLRFGGHVVSILACHDNTIEKRPGGNAAFVMVDSAPWDEEHILAHARERFPDCWERLKGVPKSSGP